MHKSKGHVTRCIECPDLGGSSGTRVNMPGANELGLPRSKSHATPHFEGPDLGGPPRGYPRPGMCTQVPPGWTTEIGTFEMRGHMTFGPRHPNFVGMWTQVRPIWTPVVGTFKTMGHKLDPGTPWITPGVTPFNLFGLYHFGVWVCYVWTCCLNPKALGLKHTGPK